MSSVDTMNVNGVGERESVEGKCLERSGWWAHGAQRIKEKKPHYEDRDGRKAGSAKVGKDRLTTTPTTTMTT